MFEFLLGLLIFSSGVFIGVIAAAFFIIGVRDKSDPPEWSEILHQQQQNSVGRHQAPSRITKNDITWEI